MRFGLMWTAFAAVLTPVTIASQIPIRVGQTVTGRLVQTDQKFADGSRYKMYAFVGKKGDAVTVDLSSDDFDSNLLIADASGNSLARNDDGAGMCNARITFVPPATGNYRVYANSTAPAELGVYRLTVTAGRVAAPADTTCKGFGRVAGMIEVGQTITGNLTPEDPELQSDSTYFERWILPVRTNQSFTVDLTSDDFDAYLILAKGRGEKLVDNDDGGGDCNARLVYTATDDHPLRIFVNTASRPRRQTGRFTLKVTEGQSAVETKGNCRLARTVASTAQTMQQSNVSRPVQEGDAAGADGHARGASGGSSTPSLATHTIDVGQTQQGTLSRNDVLLNSDSTYAQAWTIQGRAGQTITIDLESDAFDSYLFLRGPGISGGRDFQDDDSGGNCHARLTATFPQSGEYEIVVNTADHYATGAFTLSVTNGSKPKSVARCQRSNE
ncbi:MAG TPA: PPC domain-containing protein [Gemmatimonadales bacterium]|nr:PPC domain-containing protein [Gemmatimonadales bacterium]